MMFYLLTDLKFLIPIVLLFLYLLLKLLIKFICLKYNLIISFKFTKLYKFTNVYIKLKSFNLNVNVSNVCLSSSYINKNVDNLISICFYDLTIDYSIDNDEKNDEENDNNRKYLDDYLFKNCYFLFIIKYIGLYVNNLKVNIHLNNDYNKKLNIYCQNLFINYDKFQQLSTNFISNVNTYRIIRLKFRDIYLNSEKINDDDSNDDKLLFNLSIDQFDFNVILNQINRFNYKLESYQILFNCINMHLNKQNFNVKTILKKLNINNNNSHHSTRSNKKNHQQHFLKCLFNKLILFYVGKLNINFLNNAKQQQLVNVVQLNEFKYYVSSIFQYEFDDDFDLTSDNEDGNNSSSLNTSSNNAKLNCNSNEYTIKISLKSINYQTKHVDTLLLNKYLLIINLFKVISISVYCQLTNIFINANILNELIEILQQQKTQKPTTSENQLNSFIKTSIFTKTNQILFETKLLNTYFHFKNKQLPAIHTYGCKNVYFKYSLIKLKFSKEANIDIMMNNLIIHKTKNINEHLDHTFFDEINKLESENNKQKQQQYLKVHNLNKIFYLKQFELKFQSKDKRQFIDLTVFNLNIKYDYQLLRTFLSVISRYEKFYLKLLTNYSQLHSNSSQSSSTTSNNLIKTKQNSKTAINLNELNNNNNKISHNITALNIKLTLKTINFYLIYKDSVCIYASVNEILFNTVDNLSSTIKSRVSIDDCMKNVKNSGNSNEYSIFVNRIKCYKTAITTSKDRSVNELVINLDETRSENSTILSIKSININTYSTKGTNQSQNLIILNRFYTNTQDFYLVFSLSIYFILFESFNSVIDCFKKVKELYTTSKQLLNTSTASHNNSNNKQIKSISAYKMNFIIESDIKLKFLFDFDYDLSLLSPTKQIITVYPANIYIFSTSNGLKINCSKIKFALKDRYFAMIDQLQYVYVHKSDELIEERKLLNTSDPTNKLCMVRFNEIKLVFLYDYNFAKLIDHLLNLKKCYRKINNPNWVKNHSKLSCDLSIKANKLLIEIEDDPFEVKLAYNYALLVDEHHESVKRRQTLDERRLIKENHLENEAIEILKEREASVYLKRSKIMYEKPIRNQLFSIHASKIDFYAIADSKWTGEENCINLIRKIDKQSPLPPSPKYLILWCRYANLNVDSLKFQFRDYVHPFLNFEKVHLWGHVLGVELEPLAYAKRDITFCLQDCCNQEFHVQRSLSPIKFYHDLCMKAKEFSIAYAPCKEPCLAQINLALDKIIHPPRDPSHPTPWWDKSRLYLHGRLTASISKMQWIYHVSMDPYNRTEEMKWVWENLYYDWTNQRMTFKGDLKICLNTASKYDDCVILDWPNIEFRANIQWLCKNESLNPNLHNYVMLCAPEKLPTIINSCKHDSYAQYRSRNLNISLKFRTSKQPNKKNSEENSNGITESSKSDDDKTPTVKFYASTLRFLQRIKDLFKQITRPIKRGKVFSNYKPRKLLLSRHFKYVYFNIDNIDKLNIIYWSSASQQYGVQMECQNFSLKSIHKLQLLPYNDKLVRRPRADWSIELMQVKTTNTCIYLMSPQPQLKHQLASLSSSSGCSTDYTGYDYNDYENEVMENEGSMKFLDSKPAIKNFFLLVDLFTYNREQLNTKKHSNVSYLFANNGSNTSTMSRTNPPLHKIQIKNLKAKWNNKNRDVVYTLYDIFSKAKLLRHNLSSDAFKQFIFEDLPSTSNQQDNIINRDEPIFTQFTRSDQSLIEMNLRDNHQFKGSYAEAMLKKLDSERGINSEVYSDEKMGEHSNFYDLLYGVHATSKMSDIQHENIHIELINSQIKMNLQSILNDDSLKSKKNKSSTNAKSPPDLNNKDNQQQQSPQNGLNSEYLIISAAKADVIQRVHRPVWNRAKQLLDKTTWNGHVEAVQYFATIRTQDLNNNNNNTNGTNGNCNSNEDPNNIMEEYWLSDDLIDPNNLNKVDVKLVDSSMISDDFFDIYCSKNTLGMIISTFPPDSQSSDKHKYESANSNAPKLQLIVSKCRCEFYMTNFDEKVLIEDRSILEQSSVFNTTTSVNGKSEIDLNSRFKEPFDCFTLVHHDLNLCTNAAQYKSILDIVNNLVLYFRPKRKNVLDRQKSIKFNFQLTGNIKSLKERIQHKQIEIKELLCKLRVLERQLFYLKEKIDNEKRSIGSTSLTNMQHKLMLDELEYEYTSMEKEYKECKRLLNEMSEELNISINCYKEIMLEKRGASSSVQKFAYNDEQHGKDRDVYSINSDPSTLSYDIGRRYEILFKHTEWKLTESDGMIGCALFTMKNFLYTKITNQYEFDCVEHNLEIASCKVQDLTPDQHIYNDVLNDNWLNGTSGSKSVSDNNNATGDNIEQQSNTLMLRLFCKERTIPVGGIPVIEHLELNLSPISIKLTHRFYRMMMGFFFESGDIGVKQTPTKRNTFSFNNNNNNNNSNNNNNVNFNLASAVQNSREENEFMITSANDLNMPVTQKSCSNSMNSTFIETSSTASTVITNSHSNKRLSGNILSLHSDLNNDDIEIMKQRSANNNTFICIKIPEIPLLVSYKGNKEKNIKDLNNVRLLFPLFEVHNKTWTWLDLINALKSHLKKAIVSQAIKHKLIKIPIKPVNMLINRNKKNSIKENSQTKDSDLEAREKNTMLKLFGTKLIEKKSASNSFSQTNTISTATVLPPNPHNIPQITINDDVSSIISNVSSTLHNEYDHQNQPTINSNSLEDSNNTSKKTIFSKFTRKDSDRKSSKPHFLKSTRKN